MADDAASEWQHQGRVLRNRYQLSERLARGSLCWVYRGEDTVLRRSIVVKAVPPDLVACFREALRGTGALTHPAIVATYDAIEEDSWLFVVQEYVPARPLSAYLRDGIPTERAVDLAAQVARALAYAHAHDVTHGDLNPAAVLIDRQATVRISNFGLPCDPDYLQRFEGVLETPLDRSKDTPADDDEPTALLAKPGSRTPTPTPASALSAATAEPAADPPAEAPTAADDVRALGLLLWQVLSEPVRRTPSTTKASQQEPAFRQDVPSAVRELVTRCVVRSHPERIRDAEALTLALEALASELAERRPAAAEETPPALRAMRDEIAQQAPWSVEETLGSLRPWEADDEEQGSHSPSSHPLERRVARPDTQTPVVLSASRMQSPSHPRASGQAGARVSAAPPQRSSAAVERAKPRQWPMESEPGPIHINLMVVFLIGAALFVLFFLIGFFGPRLLG